MIGVRSAVVSAALGVGSYGGTSLLVPGAPLAVAGIPNRALYAYVNAAGEAPCPMDWWDLAAVGAVESGHGTHGGAHITPDGTISEPIGSSAGAQGPMQFMDTWDIPTWAGYVRLGYGDGDGDGVTNIDDIDDAAYAAAAYLCRSGYTAGDADATRNAWGAYNGGANWRVKAEPQSYVVACRTFADAYSGAGPMEIIGGPAPVSGQQAVERTPKRLAGNVWRIMMNGWTAIGRTRNPEVRETWTDLDRELFGQSASDGLSPTSSSPRP